MRCALASCEYRETWLAHDLGWIASHGRSKARVGGRKIQIESTSHAQRADQTHEACSRLFDGPHREGLVDLHEQHPLAPAALEQALWGHGAALGYLWRHELGRDRARLWPLEDVRECRAARDSDRELEHRGGLAGHEAFHPISKLQVAIANYHCATQM